MTSVYGKSNSSIATRSPPSRASSLSSSSILGSLSSSQHSLTTSSHKIEDVLNDPTFMSLNLHDMRYSYGNTKPIPKIVTGAKTAYPLSSKGSVANGILDMPDAKYGSSSTSNNTEQQTINSSPPLSPVLENVRPLSPNMVVSIDSTTGYPADALYHTEMADVMFEALSNDENHLDRLRTSLEDGGLSVGYTNASLKVVWFSNIYNERVRKQQRMLDDNSETSKRAPARSQSSPISRPQLERSRSVDASLTMPEPTPSSVTFFPPKHQRTPAPRSVSFSVATHERNETPLLQLRPRCDPWSRIRNSQIRVPPPEAFRIIQQNRSNELPHLASKCVKQQQPPRYVKRHISLSRSGILEHMVTLVEHDAEH
jgi:hypothetical protein